MAEKSDMEELGFDFELVEIERAVLNESDEGRAIAAEFVELFGRAEAPAS